MLCFFAATPSYMRELFHYFFHVGGRVVILQIDSKLRNEFLSSFLVFGSVVPRLHFLHRQMQLRPGDDVVVTQALSVCQDLALERRGMIK